MWLWEVEGGSSSTESFLFGAKIERDRLLEESESADGFRRRGGGEKGSKEVNVVSTGLPLLCRD